MIQFSTRNNFKCVRFDYAKMKLENINDIECIVCFAWILIDLFFLAQKEYNLSYLSLNKVQNISR